MKRRKPKRRKYIPVEAILRLAKDGPMSTKKGKHGYSRKVKHPNKEE